MPEELLGPYMEGFALSGLWLKLAGTVFVIVALWIARRLVLWSAERRTEDEDTRHFWKEVTGYVAIFLGVVVLSRLWFQNISGVLTVLSLVAAALTIVSKELILNFVAWPIITWRRLFGIGDRVRVGEQAGDVVDLGILYFTVAEVAPVADAPDDPPDHYTGRVVKVPNAFVLTQSVLNYSRSVDHVWNRLDVPLTAQSNWQRAEEIAVRVAAEHQSELSQSMRHRLQGTYERPVYAEASPNVMTAVRSKQLTLTVRYLCRPRRRHVTERELWRGLLEAFAEADDVQVTLT